MPFDGFVLAAVAKELAGKITGSFIDRIYQPAAEEVVLNLRQAKNRWRLLLCAHPVNARAHLTAEGKENPPSPPLFCLVLRKHLEGGRIRAVRQPGLDRVLVLEIETREETGSPALRLLICEIMGRHSNIILVDPRSGQIIDAVKRYSHLVSRYREVLPGRAYLPPPAQNKLDPLVLAEEEFTGAVLNGPLNLPLTEFLAARLDGFSKTLAKELVYRAGLPEETLLDNCGEYELQRIWQALRELAACAREGKFDPTLVGSRKEYIDFAAFDLTHLPAAVREKGEMSDLVDRFYARKEREEALAAERGALLRTVRKELKRLAKKLALHKEELENAREAETHRLSGELLMAGLHRLEKGLSEVFLENYYDPAGGVVRIPLDPGLTPLENALAYFKKYNKAKGALKAAKEIGSATEKEIAYLNSVETALRQATTMADLLEIKDELAEQGYLPKKEKKESKGKKTPSPAPPEPLAFTSSDGFPILVGRNNKQNDYLTMRLAKSSDIWLHVKDAPGAHVVIRTGGRPPGPAALREAAVLAAYYSRSRHSQNVPVDYTLRKNVSKPQGARPGFVVYKEQRTLTVNPDEELVERLKKSRE
jgi:predicted ribosome quality control (RQC) complex YloA/Tae2 family protein